MTNTASAILPTELTEEQRERAYLAIGQLMALGQDDAAAILREMLIVCDRVAREKHQQELKARAVENQRLRETHQRPKQYQEYKQEYDAHWDDSFEQEKIKLHKEQEALIKKWASGIKK